MWHKLNFFVFGLVFGFKGHSTAQTASLWIAARTSLTQQRGLKTEWGKITGPKEVKVGFIGLILQTKAV